MNPRLKSLAVIILALAAVAVLVFGIILGDPQDMRIEGSSL